MEKPMTVEVSKNNIVKIAINGDLLGGQIEALSNAIEEATQVITATFANLQNKLKVLVDLNNFSGRYVLDSLVKIVGFSNATKHCIEKTAVFGNADESNMAAEMVAALSGRSDLKTFATKEEALEWLAAS